VIAEMSLIVLHVPSSSAVHSDLKALKAAVDAAVKATRTPPEEGMASWPFTLPQEHFSEKDWRLLWNVVREIRTTHANVYRKFLYEQTIADLVVDYVKGTPTTPTLGEIVRSLQNHAKERSEWLVEVPVAHLQLPKEIVPIAKRAILVRSDQSRERIRIGSHLKDIWGVGRYLLDEIGISSRWDRSVARGEDIIDRRNFASFLIVEEGTEEVAVALAETRARLAVAFWCLLSPPRFIPSKTRPVWPTVGGWSPAPHRNHSLRRKPYAPNPPFGRSTGSVRGSYVVEYGPYLLTRSKAYLEAPFAAMDAAQRGNDAALSILSAARSLYLAKKHPSELERTERLLYVWRAKEALSHQGRTGKMTAEERWVRLLVNLRIRTALGGRGYSRSEIDEAFELSKSLRDLTTHFPEDVLVNLSFPIGRKVSLKGARVLGSDSLGLTSVMRDWPVMLAAVQEAARRLAKAAIRDGWSERRFHARFS
jgi:hypothetical protein